MPYKPDKTSSIPPVNLDTIDICTQMFVLNPLPTQTDTTYYTTWQKKLKMHSKQKMEQNKILVGSTFHDLVKKAIEEVYHKLDQNNFNRLLTDIEDRKVEQGPRFLQQISFKLIMTL